MPSSALNPPPTLVDLERRPPPAGPAIPSTPQHPAFGQSALRQRRNRSNSHSSHDSHNSHGSHSSHSSHSSYARRHPGRVPPKAASPNGAFLSVLAILSLVLAYTLVGLWIFIKGFLLTRHELTGVNECAKPFDPSWSLPLPPWSFDDASLLQWAETSLNPQTGAGECRLAPTHKKVVVLIVDALRYDFIASPPPPSSSAAQGVEDGWTPNPYYHNILSVPSQLTTRYGIPANASKPGPSSFIAHFTADPPTTTLQRLKGLTTGTLPTFIEAGANFGSAGTGVGQVNEDHWIAQFKASILAQSGKNEGGNAGLVFAGDDTWSTVFPGLFDSDKMWTYDSFNVEDLDTVDRHRFGASHPKMKVKLEEVQAFLKDIIEAIDDETLLVLMGDHGMDERETMAEMLNSSFASQPNPFLPPPISTLSVLRPSKRTTNRSSTHHLYPPRPSYPLQQPRQYHPGLFPHPDTLLRALRITAKQMRTYLTTYAKHSPDLAAFSREFDAVWLDAVRGDAELAALLQGGKRMEEVEKAWRKAAQAYHRFNRVSLMKAREVWAQFDMVRILVGLAVLVLGLAAIWMLKSGAQDGLLGVLPIAAQQNDENGEATTETRKEKRRRKKEGEGDVPNTTKVLNVAGYVILAIHAGLFASNSFLINEDRFILLSLSTLITLRGLLCIGSCPTTRGKIRSAIITLLSLLLVRLASISKVCREEQAPNCKSTFFSTEALNSPYLMIASYLFAYLLPTLLAKFLGQSKSFVGIAPLFFNFGLRPTLMLGSGYWLLDWILPQDFEPVNTASPEREENKPKVTIRGYANSLGSSYLLLVGIVVSLLWLVTQPAGQLSLAAVVLAAMLALELGDAERDTLILHDQKTQPFIPNPPSASFLIRNRNANPPIPPSILLHRPPGNIGNNPMESCFPNLPRSFLPPITPPCPAQLLRSANSPTTPPHRSIRAMELYTPTPRERKENVYSTTHLGCPTNNDAL
ncbi:related to GPI13 - protein involved in glycosylphosphatidylinositol biosynthesis [Ustilago sp. UG-2017b]|nr:related to GPI13 - protein involved in glycosylphosphatidylinositol biosynthesis [Ustilago sp. UG-2017b]